ncbi:MAG: Gfo/Idh/MocA family oxidoreductase [Planctomycetes bacterium]|nr:Gfo/Idh/MocA family oxidoreductase [Planctomycetota bacterium]
MSREIRWGILGCGNIANKFAEGLKVLDNARLHAVASRSQAKADEFAAKHGAKVACGSYEQMLAREDVDVVYIASPHSEHCSHAILCLEAGKAVLCEKPLARNTGECLRMVECARGKGLFLMEAMWTRFLPVFVQVREWISKGAIGCPLMLHADFSFRTNFNPTSRLFDPALAGGGLLDVGVYTIALAQMVFGSRPTEIRSLANLGTTGVDEQNALLLGYAGGGLALLSSGVRTPGSMAARITGSEGAIEIPSFFNAKEATLKPLGGAAETCRPEFVGTGYNYQAVEVMRCLQENLKESPIMPLEESLDIARIMDRARLEWGVFYPGEDAEELRRLAKPSN